MYGSQALTHGNRFYMEFEKDVNMYGSQADLREGLPGGGLRRM